MSDGASHALVTLYRQEYVAWRRRKGRCLAMALTMMAINEDLDGAREDQRHAAAVDGKGDEEAPGDVARLDP